MKTSLILLQMNSHKPEVLKIIINFFIIKMKKPLAIIVSGYFNPFHKGHLDYFIMLRPLQTSFL